MFDVILCKQCVFLAACTICNEYGSWCMIYGYYIVEILNILIDGLTPVVDVVGVMVWCVLIWGGYRVM